MISDQITFSDHCPLPTKRSAYRYETNGNLDRLVSFNGQSITYDAIGNPLEYLGKSLKWEYGRRLVGIDSGSVQYTYNGEWLRTSKTVDGVRTEFLWSDDGRLLAQVCGEERLDFVYGVDGVSGFVYEGELYTYQKNILGDIEQILDKNGDVVVQYTYDAWGGHVAAICNRHTNKMGFLKSINSALLSLYKNRHLWYS